MKIKSFITPGEWIFSFLSGKELFVDLFNNSKVTIVKQSKTVLVILPFIHLGYM